MTETPPPGASETTASQPPGGTPPGDTRQDVPPPPPGAAYPSLNTEHLKDYRLLRRSRTDRKVAGVAGGLGHHLNVDPTILRVLFVVLTLFGGAGLVVYAAAWILVPEEDTGETVVSTSESLRNALLIGALVLAGLLVVSGSWHGWGLPWLVAAAVVAAILLSSRDSGRPAAPSTWAPSSPPADASEPTQVLGAAPLGAGTPPPVWYPPSPPPPAPSRPRRRGPFLFGPTLALVALALGALGMYDVSGGSVADAAYPALATAVIGAMLVLGAFVGRPGGLIGLGVLAALATLAAGLGEPGFDGERDQVHRPLSAAAVADDYRVPAGRVELDLTRISELEGLDGRSIDVSANVGEIVVVVPRDLAVRVTAEIDLGGVIDTPVSSREGWDTSLEETIGGPDPRATVDLDLGLHAGHIEVRYP